MTRPQSEELEPRRASTGMLLAWAAVAAVAIAVPVLTLTRVGTQRGRR